MYLISMQTNHIPAMTFQPLRSGWRTERLGRSRMCLDKSGSEAGHVYLDSAGLSRYYLSQNQRISEAKNLYVYKLSILYLWRAEFSRGSTDLGGESFILELGLCLGFRKCTEYIGLDSVPMAWILPAEN